MPSVQCFEDVHTLSGADVSDVLHAISRHDPVPRTWTCPSGGKPDKVVGAQPGGEDMGNRFIRRRLSRVEVCRVSHEWSSPMRMRRQWKWDGFPFCSWHEPAHKTSKRASLGSPKRRLRHLVWQTRRAFGAHKPLLHVAFAHTTRATKMACAHMTRVEPQESAGGHFIGY